MIVCGLDLSLTSAGVAILRDGELAAPLRSVGHKGSDGDDYRHRSRRVRSQVRAVMDVLDNRWNLAIADGRTDNAAALNGERGIDLAVIEGPSYASQHGDAFDRAALWHGVYGALDAKGVPIAVIAPNTLKLWWTGDGHATKARMRDTAMGRVRPAVDNHDQADALALAYAGAWHVGDPLPWEPCERSVACLAKVPWPVMA